MVIAVDAAGGEYAPHEIVKGAIRAAYEFKVNIALVGHKPILHVLAGRHLRKPGFSIIDASEVIDFHESPVEAVRTKLDSSIVVGINLVRDGAAQAFVSAGHTGAVVCAALFNLGKIQGVKRPALCSVLDITHSKPVLLIDSGVNVDCRPNYLLQFAQMGSTYCRQLLGIESPRVGLLSNGEEETKGTGLVQKSHQLLKKADLNFIGNIEGYDVARGTADVIVTDGFTGNIVLKTLEGFGDALASSLQYLGKGITKTTQVQGQALLHLVGLDSWAKKVDYREYGGACLLGVNGNVIVAHGRSQAKAVKNAIGLAKQTAERGVSEQIKLLTKEESDEQTD